MCTSLQVSWQYSWLCVVPPTTFSAMLGNCDTVLKLATSTASLTQIHSNKECLADLVHRSCVVVQNNVNNKTLRIHFLRLPHQKRPAPTLHQQWKYCQMMTPQLLAGPPEGFARLCPSLCTHHCNPLLETHHLQTCKLTAELQQTLVSHCCCITLLSMQTEQP